MNKKSISYLAVLFVIFFLQNKFEKEKLEGTNYCWAQGTPGPAEKPICGP